MSLDALIDRLARQAPVATMTRAWMANILSANELDAIFRDRRQRQYEARLLFSSVVGLLTVWEQKVAIHDEPGQALGMRRIAHSPDEATAENERRIDLLTNLPPNVSAPTSADLDHRRWSMERACGEFTLSLNAEIETLCDPRAALLACAVALAIYHLRSVVKAGMSVVHGTEAVDQRVLDY